MSYLCDWKHHSYEYILYEYILQHSYSAYLRISIVRFSTKMHPGASKNNRQKPNYAHTPTIKNQNNDKNLTIRGHSCVFVTTINGFCIQNLRIQYRFKRWSVGIARSHQASSLVSLVTFLSSLATFLDRSQSVWMARMRLVVTLVKGLPLGGA